MVHLSTENWWSQVSTFTEDAPQFHLTGASKSESLWTINRWWLALWASGGEFLGWWFKAEQILAYVVGWSVWCGVKWNLRTTVICFPRKQTEGYQQQFCDGFQTLHQHLMQNFMTTEVRATDLKTTEVMNVCRHSPHSLWVLLLIINLQNHGRPGRSEFLRHWAKQNVWFSGNIIPSFPNTNLLSAVSGECQVFSLYQSNFKKK